jgi:Flp pilus assembly pilin Flp
MVFFRREQGQVGIEYVLVIGAVGVVMAIALIAGFSTLVPQVMGALCPSLDTAVPPGWDTTPADWCLLPGP